MIYIGLITEPHTHGGLNYIIHLFYATFGAPILVRTPQEVESLPRHSILILPQVFPFDYTRSDFHPIGIVDATYRTNAIVVGSLFWESIVYPTRMLQAQGLMHYLHTPSKFLLQTFQHPRSFWFPPPVKKLKRRTKAPRSNIIGILIATQHGRKNTHLINELARRLPNHKIIVVTKQVLKSTYHEVEPNVELWWNLSNDSLQEFYSMLDWFVVISGGEGYCLPAREALECGTPIIAPRHTTFLDIEGTPGVFLVDTIPTLNTGNWHDGALYFTPKIEQIVEIIKNTRPPEPQDVHNPAPPFGMWCEFWKHKIREIQEKAPREARIFVKDTPPIMFGLLPESTTTGINHVSRIWARRMNCDTFHTCYDTIMGYNGIIVVPFYEWCTPNNTTRNILTHLRKNNPHAKIVLWVHSFIHHDVFLMFAPYYDVVAATTQDLAMHVSKSKYALVLPNPLGFPTRNPKGDYWLVWGVNKTLFLFISKLLHFFNEKTIVLAPVTLMAEHTLHAVETLNWVHIRYTLPLPDDELEEIVDNAKGYLCFDFMLPNQPGEVSAKIPYVLRKNKPIVANYAPRTRYYCSYLQLLDLPMDLSDAIQHAASVAEIIKNAPEQFIPRNVPTEEEEKRIFREFIARVKTITQWK